MFCQFLYLQIYIFIVTKRNKYHFFIVLNRKTESLKYISLRVKILFSNVSFQQRPYLYIISHVSIYFRALFPIALFALDTLGRVKPSTITMEDNFQSVRKSGDIKNVSIFPRREMQIAAITRKFHRYFVIRRCKAKPVNRARVTHPRLRRITASPRRISLITRYRERERIWPWSIMRWSRLLPQSLPTRKLEKSLSANTVGRNRFTGA